MKKPVTSNMLYFVPELHLLFDSLYLKHQDSIVSKLIRNITDMFSHEFAASPCPLFTAWLPL